LIDLLLVNVRKAERFLLPCVIARLAENIAGGRTVTMPLEQDLKSPAIGRVVLKYLRGVASVPTEHRNRILRLIENLALGTTAVGYRIESMHSG
jgi:4-hydroxybutyryl-CoA dehydratase / vinylacetyl-CoA-Delta-isomerase